MIFKKQIHAEIEPDTTINFGKALTLINIRLVNSRPKLELMKDGSELTNDACEGFYCHINFSMCL
jgi:hypothetical protein